MIVYGQREFEPIAMRTIGDKTFYQFDISTRPDAPMTLWKSHTALQVLNPYVVLGIPSTTGNGGASMETDNHIADTDQKVDPNATDELPVVIVPEESKSPFSTDWDISTRLFLQIIINPSLNLPADIMALVLEARDRLRETEQAMANARIYSVADQADEIAALKAQLTAVTAERDTLAAAVAKTRSKLNDLLPSDEVQS